MRLNDSIIHDFGVVAGDIQSLAKGIFEQEVWGLKAELNEPSNEIDNMSLDKKKEFISRFEYVKKLKAMIEEKP